jgi:hypothetical protein
MPRSDTSNPPDRTDHTQGLLGHGRDRGVSQRQFLSPSRHRRQPSRTPAASRRSHRRSVLRRRSRRERQRNRMRRLRQAHRPRNSPGSDARNGTRRPADRRRAALADRDHRINTLAVLLAADRSRRRRPLLAARARTSRPKVRRLRGAAPGPAHHRPGSGSSPRTPPPAVHRRRVRLGMPGHQALV